MRAPKNRFICADCRSSAEALSRALPSAADLPRSHLGVFLEARVKSAVRKRLTAAWTKEDDAAVYGMEMSQDDIVGSFAVRVVSSVDSPCDVFGRLKTWYEAQSADDGKSLPSMSFPYRSKAIAVFQKIHGVDVLAFVLYVQEYGNECPEPNRSKVYISYLDSVSYITPKCARTEIYQEVLASYLEWSSFRGFEEAFIWACPPQRGDAYVMHCHPKWQRTPSAERLRKWYFDVMERCVALGCVEQTAKSSRSMNSYDDFFAGFLPEKRSSRRNRKAERPSRLTGADDESVSACPDASTAKEKEEEVSMRAR